MNAGHETGEGNQYSRQEWRGQFEFHLERRISRAHQAEGHGEQNDPQTGEEQMEEAWIVIQGRIVQNGIPRNAISDCGQEGADDEHRAEKKQECAGEKASHLILHSDRAQTDDLVPEALPNSPLSHGEPSSHGGNRDAKPVGS